MEKRPFFRAAAAGLGKYSTGGYSRIGVYRVKHREHSQVTRQVMHQDGSNPGGGKCFSLLDTKFVFISNS